jgi:hypothetical protein
LFNNAAAQIEGAYISYQQNYPAALKNIGGLWYVTATVASPFFSHQKKMWLLAFSTFVSYIILKFYLCIISFLYGIFLRPLLACPATLLWQKLKNSH